MPLALASNQLPQEAFVSEVFVRKILIPLASLIVVLGGVGLAPSALAANETVQF